MHNHSSIGQYIFRYSFWHHMDVRVKLLLTLIMVIAVFVPSGIYGLIIYLIMIIGVFFHAKLPWRTFKSVLKFSLFFFVFITLINGFFFLPNLNLSATENSARLGSFIYSGGQGAIDYGGVTWYSLNAKILLKSFFISVRIIIIFSTMIILSSTTKPLDLILGIEKLLKPLSYLKVPVQTMSLIISLALQSLPILAIEFHKVIRAQASRGIDIRTKHPIKKMKALSALLIPMFTSALKRAEDLSLALDSKGYDHKAKRSTYRQFHVHYSEIITLLIFLTIITLIAYNASNLVYGDASNIITFTRTPNYNLFSPTVRPSEAYIYLWQIDNLATR